MLADDPARFATTPHLREAEVVRLAATRRMTAAQKLAAVHSLQQMAWDLKFGWIRSQNPGMSDTEVDAEVRQTFSYARS